MRLISQYGYKILLCSIVVFQSMSESKRQSCLEFLNTFLAICPIQWPFEYRLKYYSWETCEIHCWLLVLLLPVFFYANAIFFYQFSKSSFSIHTPAFVDFLFISLILLVWHICCYVWMFVHMHICMYTRIWVLNRRWRKLTFIQIHITFSAQSLLYCGFFSFPVNSYDLYCLMCIISLKYLLFPTVGFESSKCDYLI